MKGGLDVYKAVDLEKCQITLYNRHIRLYKIWQAKQMQQLDTFTKRKDRYFFHKLSKKSR